MLPTSILLLVLINTWCLPIRGLNDSDKYEVVSGYGFLYAKADLDTYHCWNDTTTYQAHGVHGPRVRLTAICANDPGFYQTCGLASSAHSPWNYKENPDFKVLCSFYICEKENIFGQLEFLTGSELSKVHCNKKASCMNGDVNLKLCSDDVWACPNSKHEHISKSKVCDGSKDCFDAGDEVGCNHAYGVECISSKAGFEIWVEPRNMCKNVSEINDNGIKEVQNVKCVYDKGDDKENITIPTHFMCKDEEDHVGRYCSSNTPVVPVCGYKLPSHEAEDYTCQRHLYPSQMCGPVDISPEKRTCIDGRDQINCTNSNVVFTCTQKINEKITNIISLTDRALCVLPSFLLCDDNVNNKCEEPETDCRIHRHFICDGHQHCSDGLDEQNCPILSTEMTCVRRVRNQTVVELPILKDWVDDGIEDCENGLDEDDHYWAKCSYTGGSSSISVPSYNYKNLTDCNFMFYCPEKEYFLDPTTLCDGQIKKKCTEESRICKISRQGEIAVTVLEIKVTVSGKELVHKYIPPCLPGVTEEETCREYILEETYGTLPITIHAQRQKSLNCENLFGEFYIYAACLDLCKDTNISCPLPEVHYTKSCPTLEKRTMTLSKRNTLAFVTEMRNNVTNERNFINKEVFPCTNGDCISYTKVCDLINDCGDNSDEENCHNHYSCDESNTVIIKRSQVCDGNIDCFNGVDECDCPDQKNEKIINSKPLEVLAWLIGLPGTLINVIVIFRNIKNISDVSRHNKIHLGITVFITLIALGDLMVSAYLVLISIENVMQSEDYCTRKRQWLTSERCEMYGILSTLGSQLSVFTMTVISVYRASIMKGLSTRAPANKQFYLKLSVGTAAIIILSLLVAILPTDPYLQDSYFYNGIYTNGSLFLTPMRKDKYIPILKAYYLNNPNIIISDQDSLATVKSHIRGMFRTSLNNTESYVEFFTLGFYGSSGSCVFKYFVDPQDPQLAYTWAILTINFVCFVLIAGSYFVVHHLSRRSASKVGRAQQRFGALQKKITLIIFTDFMCWFPFIVVCLLHYFIISFDATEFYPLFSIVFLPINSLINPILYDSYFSTIPGMVSDKLSWARARIIAWSRSSSSARRPEESQNPTVFSNLGHSNENISTNHVSHVSHVETTAF